MKKRKGQKIRIKKIANVQTNFWHSLKDFVWGICFYFCFEMEESAAGWFWFEKVKKFSKTKLDLIIASIKERKK